MTQYYIRYKQEGDEEILIKNIKEIGPKALLSSKKYRKAVENFDSDLIRGISKLVVLSIIKECGDEGIYGYKIIKEMQNKTKNKIIIEEGTLYPLLRKLKENDLLMTEQKTVQGRNRTYYIITPIGDQIFNRMTGFLSILTSSLSQALDVDINLKLERYYYCPMCSNKIDINNEERFCSMCGHDVFEDLENRRGTK